MTFEQHAEVEKALHLHGRVMVEETDIGYVRITRPSGLYAEFNHAGVVMIAGKSKPLPKFEGDTE